MSFKLIAAFCALFFVGTLLSAAMEGGGGFNTTYLTTDISENAVTIPVSSTQGFLEADYVVIGNEKIRYTSKSDTQFNIPATNGRGYDGTEAEDHSENAFVLSQESDVANQMLGYNIATTGTTVGSISLGVSLTRFLFTSIPRLVTWDYAWLQGDMTIIRLALALPTAAFTVYMSYTILIALGGVAQSIFRLAT